jgi:hypothetical protein
VVIENRQNVLSTKTNTALLMSPLERSARFVQASWRRRLCMLYPKRYKERQQQQQPALSAVMSSPFVTVSVTQAAAIAPGGESSERSEGSEGSSNSTTALTSGDDPAVAVAAASDASGGGGGGGEEGSPVSVLRCCRCCRCCCLLFLKCFQLHQLTSCF